MIMTKENRLHFPAYLTLLLLGLALAGLTGCASKQAKQPEQAAPMSESAQINYDYLVYQDQLTRLQRHASMGKESPLSPEEVDAIRKRAEESLDRLLAKAPSPQLYLEKAAIYWSEDKGTARARKVLREGLEVFPDNRTLTIYLANSYVMQNRNADAVDIMNDYLSRHAEDYQVRERLAQLYMDAGNDAEGLDQYKQIPPAERSADALYGMGRAQGNLGMRKAAVANLNRAIKIDPGFTEAMVELAYQYELSKDYVAAEKMYTRILGMGQPFPEARLRLINLNLKLNNPDRALKAALEGPPSKAFIMDAALMFIDDRFFAQGSTVLDMLTSNGEIPAEFYFYKALIANDGENDMNKAMEYLSKIDKNDRLYPHALRFKAQMLHVQGKTDDALALTRQAKQRFPQTAIFYVLESKLLGSKEDLAGAEAVLKEGIANLNGNPELKYNLGMLYEDMDRRKDALGIMESVLRAHPDHTNALNYVGYTLAEENRDLDRALVLVRKANSLDPENGYIIDSVAWVYYRQGNLKEAWKHIGFAVDVVDNDPTIWEHYGDIAAAMGKTKEARKGYNYSLKFGSPHSKRVKDKLKAL